MADHEGVDGNRLILVPHAGSGKNAFYDRHSKSLQFYYYGAPDGPRYTCLSHDIIAHEAGHACLDGIRPHYYTFSSVQTAAFRSLPAGRLEQLRQHIARQVAHGAVGLHGDGPDGCIQHTPICIA